MTTWKFKPYAPDDVKEDPIQDEFFTTSDVGSLSNAVVREGIQNALDEAVKSDNDVVRVRVFLSGEKYALESEKYTPLIKDLIPHLVVPESGLSDIPDLNGKMKFLVFEDFMTNGLEGDCTEFQDSHTRDKTKPHNFFYFWRNVGRSGKSNEKLGRWGLGKTVFPASSRINTFWGVTVRASDNEKLLMGQSILRGHNLDSSPEACGYKPYGYYGNFASDCFAVPVRSEREIQIFENLFKLNRGERPGLSLIVPFCSEELTFDGLLYSVVEQYFFPILKGRLEVEVVHEDRAVLLNQENVRNVPDELNFEILRLDENLRIKEKSDLHRLFDFAKWVINLPEADFISLNAPSPGNVPQWRESLYKDLNFDELLLKYEREGRIAFRVPMKVHPKDEGPEIKWFQVFLEKDERLVKSENHFIRSGITITGIRSLDNSGVRAIVLIEDEDLVKMLGDSENPAHTEWQRDSRNFKDKYIDGAKSLSFVIASIAKLYYKLQRPVEGLDKEILKNFFYIEAGLNPEPDVTPDDDSDDESTPPPFPKEINAKPARVKIRKTPGGFIVTGANSGEEVPEEITIRMGYIVPRGNPIKKYQKLDFDLSSSAIRINPKGVTNLTAQDNILQFEIVDQDFHVEVTGFDTKRDLIVKDDE